MCEKEITAPSANKKRKINKPSEYIEREWDNDEYETASAETLFEQDPETYLNVLQFVLESGEIKLSKIVKQFNIGFIRAALLVEDFKKRDYVACDNGAE